MSTLLTSIGKSVKTAERVFLTDSKKVVFLPKFDGSVPDNAYEECMATFFI